MNKIIFFSLLIFLEACKKNKIQHIEGKIFGTYYSIKYLGKKIYEKEIKKIFKDFNNSLSTYQADSIISRINKGEEIEIDDYFYKVFEVSKKIYKISQGAFDPTLGKLVNAWGFGPNKKKEAINPKEIKKMASQIGMNKLFLKNRKVYKSKEIHLDFNAIAKGYAVDVIGEFLENKKIKNYLVEIGGEIRARGKKSINQDWIIGIESPYENQALGKSFFLKFPLKNKSIATSGSYRKFHIDPFTGKKITHILDSRNGNPSTTDVLSVSVITKECIIADGYATAFMSLGVEKSKKILEENQLDIEIYMIYETKAGKIETYKSKNFSSS